MLLRVCKVRLPENISKKIENGLVTLCGPRICMPSIRKSDIRSYLEKVISCMIRYKNDIFKINASRLIFP